MTTMSANTGLLPERVENAARERIAAGTYQTLVFGVVEGDKSEVVTFGKLDDGEAPHGDTVYEIGSITKTFTATLLAQAVLARRLTLDTPLARLLPDFKIPSRGGKEITLDGLGTSLRFAAGAIHLPVQSLRRLRCGEVERFSCGVRTAARSGRFLRILQSGFRTPWLCAGAIQTHKLGRPD
jgi:hypothetical protein